MNKKEKLILALMQVDNIIELSKGLEYTGFLTSHLLPVRHEFQRQIVLLTPTPKSDTVKEQLTEVND